MKALKADQGKNWIRRGWNTEQATIHGGGGGGLWYLAEGLGTSVYAGSLNTSVCTPAALGQKLPQSSITTGPMLSMDKNGVFLQWLPVTSSLGLAYLFSVLWAKNGSIHF